MTRKIGALWVRESQDGRKFMSGLIETLNGDVQIAVFKNDKKEKENHPDYNIVLSEKSKPAPQVEGAPGPDEIPF